MLLLGPYREQQLPMPGKDADTSLLATLYLVLTGADAGQR
jgi:hypothetical protein